MDWMVVISLNSKTGRRGGIMDVIPWQSGPPEDPFLLGREVCWPKFATLKLVVPTAKDALAAALSARWKSTVSTHDETGTPRTLWRRYHLRLDLIPQAQRDEILARAQNNEPTVIAASGGHYTWAQFRQFIHNTILDKFESDADGAEGDGQLDI